MGSIFLLNQIQWKTTPDQKVNLKDGIDMPREAMAHIISDMYTYCEWAVVTVV